MLEDKLSKKLEGVHKALVVREEIMHSFLEALAGKELRNKLILQGGGALHFGYGSPRYSKDLDFVLQGGIDSKKFENLCYELSKVLVKFEDYQTEVSVKKLQNRLYRIKIKVHFEEPQTVKKIDFDEPLTVKLDAYEIASHSSKEIVLGDSYFFVEKPAEIFADKVIADIERSRVRGSFKIYDLFDWHFILTNFDVAAEEVANLVVKKAEEYDMDRLKASDFDTLIGYLDDSRNLGELQRYMRGYISEDDSQRFEYTDAGFTEPIKEIFIKLKTMCIR